MNQSITFSTAIAIVIANMIGTGVFTSLGFQVGGVNSVFSLMVLWCLGGVIALCGALCYGELAALLPRSGGEYNFLSRIYHPAVGFLSGWVSATVGFAAPVAAASMALAKYTASVFGLNPPVDILIAIVVVVALTFIHAVDMQWGSVLQRYSTVLKLLLVAIFIGAGLFITPSPQPISLAPRAVDLDLVLGSAFFISLAYVSFSYSGWNAAAYLAGEIDNPRRNVPRALFLGTLVVTAAYVLLNFVFLYTTPMAELQDKIEIGHVSAVKIFGMSGGSIMGGMIALLLISSISSMIFAGPRVTQTMGEDVPLFRRLAMKNSRGVPSYAVILQSTITVFLILTATFESVVKYIAFTLDIFTCLTVIGVFVMRFRKPDAERKYAAWGYPVTPILFLIPTVWTMVVLLRHNTTGSLIALGTVLAGLIVYFLDKAIYKDRGQAAR